MVPNAATERKKGRPPPPPKPHPPIPRGTLPNWPAISPGVRRMPEPMVVPTPTAMPNPAPSTRSKWPLRGWGAVKRLPIRLHLGSLEPITRLPNPSMNTIASKRGHVRDQRRRQVFIGKKFHTEFRLPSRDGVPKISVAGLEVDTPSDWRVAQGRSNKRMVELGKVRGEIRASDSY